MHKKNFEKAKNECKTKKTIEKIENEVSDHTIPMGKNITTLKHCIQIFLIIFSKNSIAFPATKKKLLI